MIENKIDTPQTIILKKEQFEEQLAVLDSKYQRWFAQKNNPFTGEADNIHNYFRYFNSTEGQVQLHLKEGLPLEIGKDCRLAFETIFAN